MTRFSLCTWTVCSLRTVPWRLSSTVISGWHMRSSNPQFFPRFVPRHLSQHDLRSPHQQRTREQAYNCLAIPSPAAAGSAARPVVRIFDACISRKGIKMIYELNRILFQQDAWRRILNILHCLFSHFPIPNSEGLPGAGADRCSATRG